jgi:two-component system sensor histidine kinase UhpB
MSAHATNDTPVEVRAASPRLARWLRLPAQGRDYLLRLPIFHRLLIGNSLVIVVGAVGGTVITRQLAQSPIGADFRLIGLFAASGILLSLVVNFWIVRSALQPLRELRQGVDRVQSGQAGRVIPLTGEADPDIEKLASALNSMLQRLDERTLQLRALSERAINAQEEERKRIARGLHDDTCQALSSLIISLERLEGGLATQLPDLAPRLTAARQLATLTLEDLRKVVYGLRPTMLDDLGLAPAIRWFARANLEQAGIRVTFDGLDESARLPPRLETTLFRIAQEAVYNILRHAQAQSVTISLGRTDEGRAICLRVEDDGQGFDVARISHQAVRLQRMGLIGIRERAELANSGPTWCRWTSPCPCSTGWKPRARSNASTPRSRCWC